MICKWRGKSALHQPHRPALERLGQDGVVGVGEAARVSSQALVPRHVVQVDEQPHQLGHGQRRMRVVQLENRLIGQVGKVGVAAQVPADRVLQRGRNQEILLLQPQLLAGELLVVRVEHARDVLGVALAFDALDVVAAIEVVRCRTRWSPWPTRAGAC